MQLYYQMMLLLHILFENGIQNFKPRVISNDENGIQNPTNAQQEATTHNTDDNNVVARQNQCSKF